MKTRLRPTKGGLALRLHELEAAIMDVVWSRAFERFTVQDVHSILEREREIAYTTVMTTLGRLHRKGLLSREREGRRHIYSPLYSREGFLESTARVVLDEAVERPRALALLAERVSEASLGELELLEETIRRRREELKRG